MLIKNPTNYQEKQHLLKKICEFAHVMDAPTYKH